MSSEDLPYNENYSQTHCEKLCRELAASTESILACQAYLKALPHPRMGRICSDKFQEGYTSSCSIACHG